MSRDVVVTAGASEPKQMQVTDRNGADLTACVFSVQLVLAGNEPAPDGWGDPPTDPTFSKSTPAQAHSNVATVAVTVDADAAAPGQDYRQWVKVVDGASVYVLPCPEIIHVT